MVRLSERKTLALTEYQDHEALTEPWRRAAPGLVFDLLVGGRLRRFRRVSSQGVSFDLPPSCGLYMHTSGLRLQVPRISGWCRA